MTSESSHKPADELVHIYLKVGKVEPGPTNMPLRVRLDSQKEILERLSRMQEVQQNLNHGILGDGQDEKLTVKGSRGQKLEIEYPVTPEQVAGLVELLQDLLQNQAVVLLAQREQIEKVLENQPKKV